ncbi:hypothetical protein ACTXJR_02745 [Glutamicibacter ardleyensis]|uniref:hypothetical protein n=1 Tax=Glutamicibacter ardleyensis TaxID=225894 RepID=UPI003FD208EE
MLSQIQVLVTETPTAEPDIWLNLTQGSIGAFISLVGVFIAFLLTRSHENKQQRNEHKRIAMDSRIQASSEQSAHIVGLTLGFQSFDRNKTHELAYRLADEFTLFGLRLGHMYPGLARWANGNASNLKTTAFLAEGYIDALAEVSTDKANAENTLPAGKEWIRDPAIVADFHIELAKQALKVQHHAAWMNGYIAAWAEGGYSTANLWGEPFDHARVDGGGG